MTPLANNQGRDIALRCLRPRSSGRNVLPACSILIFVTLLAAGPVALAADDTPSTGTDFRSFSPITEHNIFDPSRRPGYRPTDRPIRTRTTESFTLIGTMSSAQGSLAFFNGSSSDFRKTAKPGDMIAGYRIAEIAHDHVKLGASSNKTINLPMLTQMRRQEGGSWSIGPRGESTEAPAPDAPPAASPSNETKTAETSSKSDAVSDVMKRLMQKREQENK